MTVYKMSATIRYHETPDLKPGDMIIYKNENFIVLKRKQESLVIVLSPEMNILNFVLSNFDKYENV